MDIKIKKMTINDFELIKNILVSDFDNFWNPKILEDELLSDNSTYFIAKLNDEIVGFAGIKIVLETADIMNIVTKKSNRNQGIGSLLLNHIISYSKQFNISNLFLEVNEDNSPAIHLYEKFGFEKQGYRKKYYNNKNGIVMALSLS